MGNRLLWVLVTCAVFLCASTFAHAQIQAFIMPESGFLRVDGQVTINPTGPQFSLRLFPGAQLTVLWTEGIEDYSIDRGYLGTVVTVRMREYGSERVLHLAYEGFLAEQTDPLTLGRDSLWFPEFSIPMQVSEFFISHSDGWHLYQLEDSYPVLVLSTQAELDITKVQMAQEPVLPAQPLPPPEEPEIPETPAVEPPPPPISMAIRTDGPAQELSGLIVLWDEAVSARDTEFLGAHVSRKLAEQGLVNYLSRVPAWMVPIESQIKSLEMTDADGYLSTVVFSSGKPLYDAYMKWSRVENNWELSEFAMHPHQPGAPQGLIDSISGFVDELQKAVAAGSTVLEEKLGLPDPAQRQLAVDFFQNLNTTEPWLVVITNPREFHTTILVKHSPRTDVAVELELTAEPTGWRIASFNAYPIN